MADARDLANVFRDRSARLTAALGRGLRRALLAVDIEHSKNLGGSGDAAPGTYPVPIRKGFLQRSRGTRMLGDTDAYVFNRAKYARAIHDGFQPYGNKRAARVGGRPYLSDAVEKAKPADFVLAALRKEVLG